MSAPSFEGRPYVIELLGGGENDGRRFERPDLPYEWCVPKPATVPELLDLGTAVSVYPEEYPQERYLRFRPTGRVTDDGAHIYKEARA